MFIDSIIYAGATWYYLEVFASYSALEWTLKIYLKLNSSAAVEILTTASGSAFFINKNAADTVIPQGKYAYQYVFTNNSTGKVEVPYEGFVEVKSLLSVAGDLRSSDELVLEKLYAARLTISGRDYVEINIGGKAAKFKTLEEIEAKINEIEKKLGLVESKRLLFRFEN